MKKILIGLVAFTLIGVVILSACAPTTAPTPTPTPTPAPTPAPEPQVFKWQAQTWDAAGGLGFKQENQALEDIRRMSGGRLDITMHAANTFVGWSEMLEATGEGVMEVATEA